MITNETSLRRKEYKIGDYLYTLSELSDNSAMLKVEPTADSRWVFNPNCYRTEYFDSFEDGLKDMDITLNY
jgi:hypothetical protein